MKKGKRLRRVQWEREGRNMTARREKGKFWFSESFCGDVHRLAECEGDSGVRVAAPPNN